MGTWGPAVKSNDTASDIYATFFDLYNEGQEPTQISNQLIQDNQEITKDYEDSNNFWFSLALALWETKNLNEEIFQKVKFIIESGHDLEVWRKLDAEESQIKKRKIALDKFLEKISGEKPKAKARKKRKFKRVIFEKGTCLTFKLNNGNYGGAIVLAADKKSNNGYNLIVSTRLNKPNKPTKKEFESSKVLVASFGNWDQEPAITWCSPDRFVRDYLDSFEVIDKIEIEKNYTPNDTEVKAGFTANWHHIIALVNGQIEFEKQSGETRSFPVTDLTRQKKWWKF